MTALRSAWTGLLLLAALLPLQLLAHEASLGVLEFREVRPGAFVGRWTMEPAIGADRVNVRVPSHCFLRLPELNCGDKGLVGPITITNLGANMSAVLIKIIPMSEQPRSYTVTTATPVVSVLGAGAPTLETWLELARTYVNYGIDHILLGADHLLFVLGLIWIVRGGWPLVKTITAFTAGHSASLAAAAFGLIGMAGRPLNACIALSIVFVGVEMVRSSRARPGSPPVIPGPSHSPSVSFMASASRARWLASESSADCCLPRFYSSMSASKSGNLPLCSWCWR